MNTVSNFTLNAMGEVANVLVLPPPGDVSALAKALEGYEKALDEDQIPAGQQLKCLRRSLDRATNNPELWIQVREGHAAYLKRKGLLPDSASHDSAHEWGNQLGRRDIPSDEYPKYRDKYRNIWHKFHGYPLHDNQSMAASGFYNALRFGALSTLGAITLLDADFEADNSKFRLTYPCLSIMNCLYTTRDYYSQSERQWALRICEEWIRLVHPLAILHAKGIIHRDVSADNIMKKFDGSYVMVDVAMSLRVEEVKYLSASAGKYVCGTHRSPEMKSPKFLPNFTDDVYAMGWVLVAEMWYRTPPRPLADVINKALSPVESRFKNVMELSRALREVRRELLKTNAR